MAALAGREDPCPSRRWPQRAARASKGSDDPLMAELGVLEELQSLRLKGASKRLVEAEKRKAKGNAAFQRGETDKAMRAYLEALWLLRPGRPFDSHAALRQEPAVRFRGSRVSRGKSRRSESEARRCHGHCTVMCVHAR